VLVIVGVILRLVLDDIGKKDTCPYCSASLTGKVRICPQCHKALGKR
jgi:predicted amidophosphoribosyltransferase